MTARILGIIGAVAAVMGGIVLAMLGWRPMRMPAPRRREREQVESQEAAEVERLEADAARARADAARVAEVRDRLEQARRASELRG